MIVLSQIVRLAYIPKFISLYEVQEQTDNTPSISQRAYVIAKSLSELKTSAISLLGVVLLILLAWMSYAYTPPINMQYNTTVSDQYKWGVPVAAVVVAVGLIWYIIKGRQLDRNFNDWKEDYSEQTYILVFDTTIPKGDNTSEKILSLARAIFPELRSNYIPPGIRDRIKLHFKRKLRKSEEMIISESMNYKVSSEYSVDLALRTPDGYFIVKDFKDKVVSLEELKHLVKILGRKFRDIDAIPTQVDIFRVICVAKTYDESFLNMDTLEKQMTKELKAKFKIDLILEEKVGYSVLWVS